VVSTQSTTRYRLWIFFFFFFFLKDTNGAQQNAKDGFIDRTQESHGYDLIYRHYMYIIDL
jgi:hypothetical protein